jgi:hypothetical protein
MKLKIEIDVKDRVEAYRLVSFLGLKYKIKEADFDGKVEKFSEKHKPNQFLKETLRKQ